MRGPTEKELAKASVFVRVAIPKLLKESKPYVNKKGQSVMPEGIHSTFSPLRTYFEQAFAKEVKDGLDYVETLKDLEESEVIASRRAFKGAVLYLWENKPATYRPRKDIERVGQEIADEMELAMLEAEEQHKE